MKAKNDLKLFSVLIIVGVFLFNSCSEKQELTEENLRVFTENSLNESELLSYLPQSSNSNLKNTETFDACGEVSYYPLIASKHYYVGALIVYNDADSLYIIYQSVDGLQLTDFHLYIGNLAGLPVNKGNNIMIGKFPYKDETSVTDYKRFAIAMSDIKSFNPNLFLIAAHAVLCDHTIWAYHEDCLSFSKKYGSSRWGWMVKENINECEGIDLTINKIILIKKE